MMRWGGRVTFFLFLSFFFFNFFTLVLILLIINVSSYNDFFSFYVSDEILQQNKFWKIYLCKSVHQKSKFCESYFCEGDISNKMCKIHFLNEKLCEYPLIKNYVQYVAFSNLHYFFLGKRKQGKRNQVQYLEYIKHFVIHSTLKTNETLKWLFRNLFFWWKSYHIFETHFWKLGTYSPK